MKNLAINFYVQKIFKTRKKLENLEMIFTKLFKALFFNSLNIK